LRDRKRIEGRNLEERGSVEIGAESKSNFKNCPAKCEGGNEPEGTRIGTNLLRRDIGEEGNRKENAEHRKHIAREGGGSPS